MAKIRLTSPTFDASAKTITHASLSDITLAGIQLIVNVTDQVIIYNFADITKGGTLAGDTLTLEFDTTTMDDTDQLMVLVEDGLAYQLPTGASTEAKQDTLIAAVDTLEALLGTIDADTGAILTAVDGIETLIAATNTKLDTVIGHVDGIETAIASTNTKLDTLNTAVDTLETLVATTNTTLTTIDGRVDGLETIGTATNTKLDTLITQTDTVETVLGTIDADTSALATAIGVEDAAETAGGGLMMAGSVRRDTAASSAGTTGDNATLNTDSVGALWTRDTATQVDDAAFTPGTGRIMPIGYIADETATDSVDEGDAGAARMTLDRKQIVTPAAHTSGGATPYKLVSAASTNATSVKGSAGQVYMITASNVNAAARYLKLYNKASAPTVGTDVPVHTFIIPGNTAGAGTNIPVPAVGLNFSTGIAFALTTEATDAGTTAVAASEIVVNLGYL